MHNIYKYTPLKYINILLFQSTVRVFIPIVEKVVNFIENVVACDLVLA